MWSSNVEELKKLNTSDTEVAQLVKAKQAGLSDDACVTLVNDAHQRQHPFVSADSTVNLAHAGYTEAQILEIAQADQLDVISGDAVVLRLVGLSDRAVEMILHRRFKGERPPGPGPNPPPENTRAPPNQTPQSTQVGLTAAPPH